MASEWIAACTVCPWIGVEVDTLDGFDVCPECQSEVEWEPATGGGDPEEMSVEEAYELGALGNETALERHWRTGLPPRPSGGKDYRRVSTSHGQVIASKPRQALLKACLNACCEQGRLLRWSRSAQRRAEGLWLLRTTGRVCVAPAEVAHDPAQPS